MGEGFESHGAKARGDERPRAARGCARLLVALLLACSASARSDSPPAPAAESGRVAAARRAYEEALRLLREPIHDGQSENLLAARRELREEHESFGRALEDLRRARLSELERRPPDRRDERGALATQIRALEIERERALLELRMGLFCSQCERSKSQIEREERKPFEEHLVDVKGRGIPADPALIERTRRDYERRIEQLEQEAARLAAEESAAREAQERGLAEIERRQRELHIEHARRVARLEARAQEELARARQQRLERAREREAAVSMALAELLAAELALAQATERERAEERARSAREEQASLAGELQRVWNALRASADETFAAARDYVRQEADELLRFDAGEFLRRVDQEQRERGDGLSRATRDALYGDLGERLERFGRSLTRPDETLLQRAREASRRFLLRRSEEAAFDALGDARGRELDEEERDELRFWGRAVCLPSGAHALSDYVDDLWSAYLRRWDAFWGVSSAREPEGER